MREGILRNFAKFTGKHLRQSLFFNKLYAKFLKTPFLQNTSGRLLLCILETYFLVEENFKSLFIFLDIISFPHSVSRCLADPSSLNGNN